MTGTTSAIEWYLARDGQQHGPLSETEMRTFVDMGHLREQDLVWRSGFADWRSAPDVFAIQKPLAPNPSAPAAAAPPQPSAYQPLSDRLQSASRAPAFENERTPDQPASAAAPRDLDTGAPIAGHAEPRPTLLSPDQLAYTAETAKQSANAQAARPNFEQETTDWPSPPLAASEDRASGPTYFGRGPDAVARYSQVQQTQARPAPIVPARTGVAGSQSPSARSSAPPQGALSKGRTPGTTRKYDEKPKRNLGIGKIAAALVVALIVGAGAAAMVKREELMAYWPAGLPPPISSGTTLAAAPFVTAGNSPDTIDDSFQRTAIWRHIKAEFPEWYADRVSETAKLSAEKRGETVIAKHLAEAVVALRRKHADQALTASPERLRFVASAFIDNLQALAKLNVDTCYGFISQGETYPAVLEMLQKQGTNEPLQKQVIAVFEAISDGRKSPQNYLPPRKTDYDALATELTSRGWTQADLQTFSDPRALGRASPQQVCKMVQDWFSAQISIKDPAAQLRLLVESLRPVVAG